MAIIHRALPCLLAMWFLAGIAAKPAHSGVIYTYTGNQFNDFRNGGSCPPTCNVDGVICGCATAAGQPSGNHYHPSVL